MSPEPPNSTASSPWPARVQATVTAIQEWVTRPRVTLCMAGIVLAFVGLLLTNSVWTLPLVIVGAVMVVVAWVGHRLEGRFAVEWGKTGTELAFRATVKPARRRAPDRRRLGRRATTPRAEAPRPPEDNVIEGEAHTVEVDVGELKALIAAVEAEPSAVADRVRAARHPRPPGRQRQRAHLQRLALTATGPPDLAATSHVPLGPSRASGASSSTCELRAPGARMDVTR